MLRSITVYQLSQATTAVLEKLEPALQGKQFADCLPKQARSRGFVPPLEGGKELIYTSNGGTLFCLRTDEKEVPSSAVRSKVEAKRKAAEDANEEFNKTDERLAKEEIVEGFLPGIPPKSTYTFAYIDQALHMMLVGASDDGADEFRKFLEEALDATPFKLLGIEDEPCDKFTEWLRDPETLGDAFQLGHTCALKHAKEGGCAVINIKNEDLESDEMDALLDAGKECCSISLEHEDLNFRLTSKLGLRNVSLGEDMRAEAYDEEEGAITRPNEFAALVVSVREVMQQLAPLLGGWPQQELLDLKDQQPDEDAA